LGEKDPKVAESLKELANVLSKEHKTAEADAVLSQALEIDPKSSLGVQANILQQQGKLSEAEAVLRKRLETQNSLGTNHPDVALSLGNLSRTYRDMGQLTKSIVAAEKALQATKSKVGEAQPQTVVALGDLAELYGQAGRSKDVAAIENEVRKIGDLKGANFPAAMRGIGRGYRDCGLYADSLRVFLGVADKGDSFCTSEVGWAYEQGLAVPKDLAEAAKWYRKAAELGNEWSWQRLAVMYDKGQGVPKDPVEAAICYTRDAELGNASSQVALAQIYQHGQGVETNLPEAVKWYRKAADSDNVTALAALLRMSQRGEIAAVNSVEFEKRLEKAADRGDIRTKYDLGRLYERDDGLPNDPAKAAKWYRSVIESGNASELNDIAWSLATSARTEGRDGRNAIAFAQKAVEATGRNEPNYVDTLAAAYAEAGDFQKAVAIQEEAIALLKDEAAKKDFSSRLKVYESGMPYHEGP
jgi:TPR repeat protein